MGWPPVPSLCLLPTPAGEEKPPALPLCARPAGGREDPGGVGQGQGGCCVLTEDFPVVQAEHAPESGHLAVTFLPAVSAFRGWPAEVGRAGTLEGGRSELDPDTSALSRLWGWAGPEAFSQPLRPHL